MHMIATARLLAVLSLVAHGGCWSLAARRSSCSSTRPSAAACRRCCFPLLLPEGDSAGAAPPVQPAAELPPPPPVAPEPSPLVAGVANGEAAGTQLSEQAAAAPLVETPPREVLEYSDLVNTKWALAVTPRPDGWLGGPVREQEFTLLADDSVVWGGTAGGFGTGGRWTLKEGLLEVIRTTPLGLVTGRDYYMATAEITGVDAKLRLQIEGIIRSYNALYPVGVVADFVGTRAPGRFAFVSDDEEAKGAESAE